VQKLDLIGQVFGRITVIAKAPSKKTQSKWLVKCTCGNEKEVLQVNLRNGSSTSCGCYRTELNTKHGDSKSRLHNIWGLMRQRCTNPNVSNYSYYGGRGISVCKEWENYLIFKEWALLNNYEETLEIDRINNDLGYFPDNCRWVNRIIQTRNRRSFKNSISKYIGVKLTQNKNKPWRAEITVDTKTIHLGVFETELEAAQVRDTYVKENNLIGFTINLTGDL
jgi:hypothetical protein